MNETHRDTRPSTFEYLSRVSKSVSAEDFNCRVRASRSAANTPSQCMRRTRSFISPDIIPRKLLKLRKASSVIPFLVLTFISRVSIMTSTSFSSVSINASLMTLLNRSQGGTAYSSLFTARILNLGLLKFSGTLSKMRAD